MQEYNIFFSEGVANHLDLNITICVVGIYVSFFSSPLLLFVVFPNTRDIYYIYMYDTGNV
jgi:hypothetical protein